MAVSRTTDSKSAPPAAGDTRTAKADPPDTDPVDTPTAAPQQRGQRVSDCVVNDGRGMHVGRAVNGKVCSYHAMRYHADGTPR